MRSIVCTIFFFKHGMNLVVFNPPAIQHLPVSNEHHPPLPTLLVQPVRLHISIDHLILFISFLLLLSLSLFYKGGIIIIIKRKTLAMNCTFFVVALSFFSTTFPVQFIALKMFVENESNHRFLGTLAVGEKLFCVRKKGKKKQ